MKSADAPAEMRLVVLPDMANLSLSRPKPTDEIIPGALKSVIISELRREER